MHACLPIAGALLIMSDGCDEGKTKFAGFSISLDFKNVAEAEGTSTRWPTAAR